MSSIAGAGIETRKLGKIGDGLYPVFLEILNIFVSFCSVQTVTLAHIGEFWASSGVSLSVVGLPGIDLLSHSQFLNFFISVIHGSRFVSMCAMATNTRTLEMYVSCCLGWYF